MVKTQHKERKPMETMNYYTTTLDRILTESTMSYQEL
jgi:hypothetical protein